MFGFDANNFVPGTTEVLIYFSDGTTSGPYDVTPVDGTQPDFFGFESNLADIIGADIYAVDPTCETGGSCGYGFAVDNFVFAPEPGTMGIFALGVAGLGALRRRRRA